MVYQMWMEMVLAAELQAQKALVEAGVEFEGAGAHHQNLVVPVGI